MLHSRSDISLLICLHIWGPHARLPPGPGIPDIPIVDKLGTAREEAAGLGRRLDRVVSIVFMTDFKLLSHLKSEGRNKWEKS